MSDENWSVRVWYDSKCPLCVREIDLMRRLDARGAIDFVDLYTARDCPVDPGDLLARFHAQEAGQPAVSGAAAFAAMWRAIPALRPLGLRKLLDCRDPAIRSLTRQQRFSHRP